MSVAIDAISYAQLHEQLVQCEADGNAMAGENARLRAALSKLVTTITAVENSPSFQCIWPYLHAHGFKYEGPDWRDALADARLALATDEQYAYRLS